MKEKHLIDAPGKHFAVRLRFARPRPRGGAGPNSYPRTPTIWLSRDSSTIFDDPATVCVIATISMFPLFT